MLKQTIALVSVTKMSRQKKQL